MSHRWAMKGPWRTRRTGQCGPFRTLSVVAFPEGQTISALMRCCAVVVSQAAANPRRVAGHATVQCMRCAGGGGGGSMCELLLPIVRYAGPGVRGMATAGAAPIAARHLRLSCRWLHTHAPFVLSHSVPDRVPWLVGGITCTARAPRNVLEQIMGKTSFLGSFVTRCSPTGRRR